MLIFSLYVIHMYYNVYTHSQVTCAVLLQLEERKEHGKWFREVMMAVEVHGVILVAAKT